MTNDGWKPTPHIRWVKDKERPLPQWHIEQLWENLESEKPASEWRWLPWVDHSPPPPNASKPWWRFW